MRRSNDDVIKAWSYGNKAKNHTGSLESNGAVLRSYGLTIGVTSKDGQKIVFDYTAKGGWFTSQTTSTHVGKAKRIAADQVMLPDAAILGGLSQ